MGLMSLVTGMGVTSVAEGAEVMSLAVDVEVTVIGCRRGADLDGPWHKGRNSVVFTVVSQVPYDSAWHTVGAR